MNENDSTLSALQAALQAAIDAGDARAESVARVNIACAYLQLESAQALPAFEEALAAVRRAQNPRSEAILSMVFAPYFVEIGDPARALELAQRGEQIARKGRIGHRVLSLIQLARVLYTGFADPEQAGHAVDLALAELAEGEITNPTDREVVLQAVAQAALAAVQAHDIERAVALTRVVDPSAAEQLEQQRPPPNAGLNRAQRDEVKRLYAQWQPRFASGGAADPRVAEMARKTGELLRWDKARARRGGSSADAESVAAFVERVHVVARGGQTTAAAITAGPGRLTDDDLVFVLALATDRGFNTLLPGWAVFEVVGGCATDRALVGRCFRLAAAIGHEARPPGETLNLLRRAEAALAGGADDRLLAEVLNEIAVSQLNLREAELALEAAQRAADLARKCGDDGLGRMARGNVANALLGLQRVAEALKIFEPLARDQAAAGEREMTQITLQNIEACRAFLKRHGKK
jgi:hypothetical protein